MDGTPTKSSSLKQLEMSTIFHYKKTGNYPPGSSDSDRRNIRKRSKSFLLTSEETGEKLYYRPITKETNREPGNQNKRLVLCNNEERLKAIAECHVDSKGTHIGRERLTSIISEKYYWLGISSMVRQFIRHCAVCQATRFPVGSIGPMTLPLITYSQLEQNGEEFIDVEVGSAFSSVTQSSVHPIGNRDSFQFMKMECLPTPMAFWEIVEMCIYGPFICEEKEYYIIVFMDAFSHWPEVFSVESVTSVVVTHLLLCLISRFGVMQTFVLRDVHTFDKETISPSLAALIAADIDVCIKHTKCQETYGVWQEIKESLQSFIQNNPDLWIKCLDFAMLPHRISRGDFAEYTPAFLTYGRELCLPKTLSHRLDPYMSTDPHLIPEQMLFTQNQLLEAYTTQENISREMAKEVDKLESIPDTGSDNTLEIVFKVPETSKRRGRKKKNSVKAEIEDDDDEVPETSKRGGRKKKRTVKAEIDDDDDDEVPETSKRRGRKKKRTVKAEIEDEDDDEVPETSKRRGRKKKRTVKTEIVEDNEDAEESDTRSSGSSKNDVKIENICSDTDQNGERIEEQRKKDSDDPIYDSDEKDIHMNSDDEMLPNDEEDSSEHNYANTHRLLEKVDIDIFYKAIKLYLTEKRYLPRTSLHFKRVIRQNRPLYQVKDNMLYYIGYKNPKMVADTFEKRMKLLQDAHVDKKGNHKAKKQMSDKLTSTYIWKGLHLDCEAFVLACEKCRCVKLRKVAYVISEEEDETELVHYIVREEQIAKEAENYYGELLMYLQNQTFPPNFEAKDRRMVKKLAKKFSLEDGTLYFKRNPASNKRRLELTSRDRRKVMKEAHDKGIHRTVHDTLKQLSQNYLWWGMRTDVETYIRHCCNKLSTNMREKQTILKKSELFKKYLEKKDSKTKCTEAHRKSHDNENLVTKTSMKENGKKVSQSRTQEELITNVEEENMVTNPSVERTFSQMIDKELQKSSEPSTNQDYQKSDTPQEEQIGKTDDVSESLENAENESQRENQENKENQENGNNFNNTNVELAETEVTTQDNSEPSVSVVDIQNCTETTANVVEPLISIPETSVENIPMDLCAVEKEIQIQLTPESKVIQTPPINIVNTEGSKKLLQTLVPASDLVTTVAVNSILPENEQIPISDVSVVSNGIPQQIMSIEELTSPQDVSILKKMLEQRSVMGNHQSQNTEPNISSDEYDKQSDNTDQDYQPEEDEENSSDVEQVNLSDIEHEEQVEQVKDEPSDIKPVIDAIFSTEQRGPTGFKCDICGKSIRGYVKFKVHMYQHTGEKPFSCQQCNKKFTNPKSLKLHARKHTGLKPYLCNICGKGFALVGSLRAHIKIHENGGNVQVHCVLCDRTFSTQNRYDKHMKFRHPPEPVVYACEPCNKTFTTSRSLKRHTQSTHLKERNFQCDTCGKQFNRREYLNNHKIHHQHGHVPRRGRPPRAQVPVQNEMQLSAPCTVTETIVEPHISIAQTVYDHDLEGGYYTITTETNDDDQQVTHTLVYNYPAVEYEVECGSSTADPIDTEALSAINLLAQASVSQGY